jgi:tetratricopeptide (TPR) repeat protein
VPREDTLFLKITSFFFILFFCYNTIFSETVAEYLNQGEALYKEKNYRQALSSFRSAIHINPDSKRSLMGFAKSSLALGSLEDAKISYKKVLEKDPKNKEAQAGVAEILSLEEKHFEALEILEAGLKDEPYNPLLLVTRATIYLRMGKSDVALRRLEEAKTKVKSSYEYNLLLAKAYSANKKYKQADEIISQLMISYPENPGSFLEKAKLNYELAATEKTEDNLHDLMKDSLYRLGTVLTLDSENTEAKRLKIKNHIWLGEYKEALIICEELLSNFPSDTSLLYYDAYLNEKLDLVEKASISYSSLLSKDDLNSVGRIAAERFAVSKLPEKHPLRLYLGRYRIEQYKKFFNDYIYSIANLQLNIAKDLIPENKELKKILVDHYYGFGYRVELTRMLLKMRADEPDDIKINNRLEAVLKSLRQSLGYKEGFLDADGKLLAGIRSQPEIFLFDLKPRNFLPDYPNASLQITHGIKYAISLKPNLRVVSGTAEELIRKKINEERGSEEKYTNATYFQSELLDKLNTDRKSEEMIRYIGYGDFQINKNLVKVNFNIYDRTTGRILENSHFSVQGRSGVSEVATRLAEVVSNTLPNKGRVIKIKTDSLLINLGFRDSLRVGDIYSIENDGKTFGNLKIVETDEYISRGKMEGNDWKEMVGLGFQVKLKEKSKDKVKPQ